LLRHWNFQCIKITTAVKWHLDLTLSGQIRPLKVKCDLINFRATIFHVSSTVPKKARN